MMSKKHRELMAQLVWAVYHGKGVTYQALRCAVKRPSPPAPTGSRPTRVRFWGPYLHKVCMFNIINRLADALDYLSSPGHPGSTISVIRLALVTSWLQGTAGATPALMSLIAVAIGAVLVFGVEYILKEMTPFVHYAVTLAIGLVRFM